MATGLFRIYFCEHLSSGFVFGSASQFGGSELDLGSKKTEIYPHKVSDETTKVLGLSARSALLRLFTYLRAGLTVSKIWQAVPISRV